MQIRIFLNQINSKLIKLIFLSQVHVDRTVTRYHKPFSVFEELALVNLSQTSLLTCFKLLSWSKEINLFYLVKPEYR